MNNILKKIGYTTNILLFATILITSCSNHTPKPYGFFRIDLPENEYRVFDSIYPPIMEVSKYARIVPVKSHLPEKEKWIDILYPQFNGRIHCSYIKINNDFHEVSEDNRSLVYKHTVRADAIGEQIFEHPEARVYGILYQLAGNAASPLQFVLTDSTQHFLRGALYFNSSPNPDSIAPVKSFIEKDLMHLIETIQWKN